MNRTAVVALAATSALCTVGGVAEAKHKKPITKSYTATAPLPDPTNYGMQSPYSVCAQNVPQSFDVEEFSPPEAGTLKIVMTGFQGDWDLLITDSKGREIGNAGSSDLGGTENASVRIKKPGAVNIIACNWAGSASAAVKYTFTFTK